MGKILEFEFLRGFAAFYVFFHHTVFQFNIIEKNSILGKLFSFGQEAVMLFFLLSGYVIALSLMKRKYSFYEYLKHRFLRIYPILLFVITVSILLKITYSNLDLNFNNLLLNLLMLQDISALKPGTFTGPFLGNSPLWFLSYEWWFYIIFFIHLFLYQKFYKNINFLIFSGFIFSIIGLISYYYFPNQISLIVMYYYIWLSGAIVCIIYFTQISNKKKSLFTLLIIYLIIICFYFILFVYNEKTSSIGIHPLLELRHYLTSFLFLVVSLIYAKYLYNYLKNNLNYQKFLKLGLKPASISFGVYVIHYPIMQFFMYIYENFRIEEMIIPSNYILFTCTIILTLILSYIAEIRIYGSLYKKFVKKVSNEK